MDWGYDVQQIHDVSHIRFVTRTFEELSHFDNNNSMTDARIDMAALDDEDATLCAAPASVRTVDKTQSHPPPVDAAANRFPFCIVWSPLPGITWFLPFIGHMGIATSDGIIYDFAGPYTIGREHFAFGKPTRYLQLRVAPDQAERWDRSVARGCSIYETRMHNLCCDNCHSHVATCLEHMQYQGRSKWDMVTLCFWMFFCGRYVDAAAVLKSWLPFVAIVVVLCVVL